MIKIVRAEGSYQIFYNPIIELSKKKFKSHNTSKIYLNLYKCLGVYNAAKTTDSISETTFSGLKKPQKGYIYKKIGLQLLGPSNKYLYTSYYKDVYNKKYYTTATSIDNCTLEEL